MRLLHILVRGLPHHGHWHACVDQHQYLDAFDGDRNQPTVSLFTSLRTFSQMSESSFSVWMGQIGSWTKGWPRVASTTFWIDPLRPLAMLVLDQPSAATLKLGALAFLGMPWRTLTLGALAFLGMPWGALVLIPEETLVPVGWWFSQSWRRQNRHQATAWATRESYQTVPAAVQSWGFELC